ncbi:VanSc-type vancomycin resistance histidine kinase VanS [Kribbella albertanoniae]|uniref:histidine kinase n=1 Tax=Kribbella albertanoniae TaxID=1266829 RepID=A0A4R4PDF8_9ACTN|nr:HAMP domain-containing sensor histidine kinase [Kribbella albertanoniae]TDC18592.1 HAMP domain-containing histidine kinase [Kribbella albertanoniae]
MTRQPGLSIRLKLTLSYTGLVMVTGILLMAAVALSLKLTKPDGLVITVEYGYYEGMLRRFVPAAGVTGVFLLILGLVGGWFLAGRMLAPVALITSATRQAATGSLSHRINMPGRNDEFRELADSFDAMLAQLEQHVAEQRRFAANASHELRTPLAITQTLLDVARKDPDRPPDELVDRLHAVNARAIDLTEALLLLSRTDQGTFTREDVDLSLVAEEAAEALLAHAEERDVLLETSGEMAFTVGSRALLLQLTTNLVHNAIVHNTAEGGIVQVETAVWPESAVLTVENTGPEVTPELLSTLTEPFQRGAERIRSDHGGVGLGLAIVKRIIEAHHGTLRLMARPDGGLRVTVELPRGGTTTNVRSG